MSKRTTPISTPKGFFWESHKEITYLVPTQEYAASFGSFERRGAKYLAMVRGRGSREFASIAAAKRWLIKCSCISLYNLRCYTN